jgi:hypothetical protein
MLTRIIAIEEPWGKYVKRTEYARNILLPQLLGIGLDCKISNAVTPGQLVHGADCVTYYGRRFHCGSGSAENFLSNYNIWEECIAVAEPILIIEDDAQLLAENAQTVLDALREWDSPNGTVKEVLYLLSSVPYLQNRLKDYALWVPLRGTRLKMIANSWKDFAGTAAYAITPDAALELIHLADDIGIQPTDQFLQAAINRRVINCIVPMDHQKCFTLHPELYWG